MTRRCLSAILCAITCFSIVQRCFAHHILFSIWGLAPASRAHFMHLYQNAVLCGADVECPQFTPDLHKFDREEPHDNSTVYPQWTREQMPASRRLAQLSMTSAKALDVAATRALGCSPVYMLDSLGLERDANSSLITRTSASYEHCPAPAAANHPKPTANIISPYVSYAVNGEVVSREAFLASNHAWYQCFGFNPFASSDARLAYHAPRFTKRDWLLFCSMALSASPNALTDRAHFSRIFSGVSLAHRACAAFSDAAHGKRFGMLPPCFEFTRASPANEFHHSNGGVEEEYVQACVQYEEDGSAPPAHLTDLFRINVMLQAVYDILLLRWSRVQSVYDLAIYQESRDVQRLDEFFETLQWNVCHPDVSSVHLFVEDDGGRAFMQRHLQSPGESPLIDMCSKVVFHDLGRTMRYSDSVTLANERMSGQFVLLMHADVYAGIIFSDTTTTFMLDGKLRMFVAPLPHDVISSIDHQQNVWNGENVFLWAMLKHGVQLFNPCQLVHVWHNHASDLRKNQNSTQLGLLTWGPGQMFPCPPQLLIGENQAIIFGHCAGKSGWGKAFFLQDEYAYELLMVSYRGDVPRYKLNAGKSDL